MLVISQFKTLFAHHWHTNARLINVAAKLDEVAFRENPGYGRGSIHDLFIHLLRTNYGWRVGMKTGQQPPPLRQEDYPNLKALKIGFEREQLSWQELLAELSAEEI